MLLCSLPTQLLLFTWVALVSSSSRYLSVCEFSKNIPWPNIHLWTAQGWNWTWWSWHGGGVVAAKDSNRMPKWPCFPAPWTPPPPVTTDANIMSDTNRASFLLYLQGGTQLTASTTTRIRVGQNGQRGTPPARNITFYTTAECTHGLPGVQYVPAVV